MTNTTIIDNVFHLPDRRQWKTNNDDCTHVGLARKEADWTAILDYIAIRINDPNTSEGELKSLTQFLSLLTIHCGSELTAMLERVRFTKFIEPEKQFVTTLPYDIFAHCEFPNEHYVVTPEKALRLAANRIACILCNNGSIIFPSARHFNSEAHAKTVNDLQTSCACLEKSKSTPGKKNMSIDTFNTNLCRDQIFLVNVLTGGTSAHALYGGTNTPKKFKDLRAQVVKQILSAIPQNDKTSPPKCGDAFGHRPKIKVPDFPHFWDKQGIHLMNIVAGAALEENNEKDSLTKIYADFVLVLNTLFIYYMTPETRRAKYASLDPQIILIKQYAVYLWKNYIHILLNSYVLDNPNKLYPEVDRDDEYGWTKHRVDSLMHDSSPIEEGGNKYPGTLTKIFNAELIFRQIARPAVEDWVRHLPVLRPVAQPYLFFEEIM